ncbi:hypothetical protein L915_13098 [Phytophthora nicotianae]|uniref:Uncharacterized protein n=1 Tax=Phytophthora nicotianae TaxID=4792 RepID=W2GED6_PHYNI|nr:hypothetical protein L915_13098 [Phytophthora nicotianae]
MGKDPKHRLAARKRVCVPRNIVKRGSAEVKKKGGARAARTKFTSEMEEALVEYMKPSRLL